MAKWVEMGGGCAWQVACSTDTGERHRASGNKVRTRILRKFVLIFFATMY